MSLQLRHSYGSSDAPVAPAVLNVLFLASLLFVHFACSSWPSCALRGLSLRRILTGNYAGKNAYFLFNTSTLFKNVPQNLNFRASLLHNVSA